MRAAAPLAPAFRLTLRWVCGLGLLAALFALPLVAYL
jgi:hypothetical protein